MKSAICGQSPKPSRVLKRLHRRRNYVPVSETLHELLGATRAHVGFALRTGGEQVLANAFHVAELARQFEVGGGISFRGFVEELRVAAENAVAAEAPILEEDSDGVRMMTVHKAKGLEFPIVILADLTCKLARAEAGRWIDPAQNVCALKLGGWAPMDLLLHDAEESARDRAEGERLAYVAATRARDVLVVPAVGDEIYEGSWLDPLMPAIYPPLGSRRDPAPAPGCPAFPSKDTVLTRADGDPARPTTVAPGMFEFALPASSSPLPASRSRVPSSFPDPGSRIPDPDKYQVVWWDPHSLILQAPNAGGLRRDDLIAKDGDQAGVDQRMSEYRAWQADRTAAVARASAPSIVSHTATDLARDRTLPQRTDEVPIEVIDLPRAGGRPFGPRFGSLVHATLATVALDAQADAVLQIARTHARVLLADDGEVAAAAEAVTRRAGAPALHTGPRRERGRALRARVPPPLARARRIDRRGDRRRRVRRGRRADGCGLQDRPRAVGPEGSVRAPADALLPRVCGAAWPPRERRARAGLTRRNAWRATVTARAASVRSTAGQLDRRPGFHRLGGLDAAAIAASRPAAATARPPAAPMPPMPPMPLRPSPAGFSSFGVSRPNPISAPGFASIA